MMLIDPSQPPLRSTVKDLHQGNFEGNGEELPKAKSIRFYGLSRSWNYLTRLVQKHAYSLIFEEKCRKQAKIYGYTDISANFFWKNDVAMRITTDVLRIFAFGVISRAEHRIDEF